MTRFLERLTLKPVPAIRLSISRLNSGWAVVDEQKIKKMMLPAHHEFTKLSRNQAVAGSWFEVRDEQDELVYRRRFNFTDQMETHHHKGQTTRQRLVEELINPIQIIIPDIDQTRMVLLFTTVDHKRGRQIRPGTVKKPIPFAAFKRTN